MTTSNNTTPSFDIHVHADRQRRTRASFTLPDGRHVGPFILDERQVRALRVIVEFVKLAVVDSREAR